MIKWKAQYRRHPEMTWEDSFIDPSTWFAQRRHVLSMLRYDIFYKEDAGRWQYRIRKGLPKWDIADD